ncbi:MAG: outer membrane lipoprotein-sorting protein [Desulfuromonas sp.]|nr:MAG: outer membrane lipoprotein-sorting protein [Desulfuromonas sp.]
MVRILFSFFLLATFCMAPARATELNLQELIRSVEDQHWGISSQAVMEMSIKTTNWERTTVMDAWSLGRDYFLIRISEPAKERGVATLKVEDEVWNYLPKVDRTIRIPPSMMGGAWMGSHITNNDLVKASHVDEDYLFKMLEETGATWLVEGLPREDAVVIWGKIVYLIDKSNRVPIRVDYFDEEGVKVRTMEFDRVTTVGDREVPMRMTIRPLEKPGELTVMDYRELAFDVGLDKRFFSLRQLKAR